MKKIIFTTAFLLSILINSVAQPLEAYNITDEDGMKQGYWEKRYENGNIQYSGFFKNDRPIGIFKRFDIDGIRYVLDSSFRGHGLFDSKYFTIYLKPAG